MSLFNRSARTVPAEVKAPSPLLLMMEARAPWELAALWLSAPWLRQLGRGDGHPVLVFPGLGANDVSTLPLRNLLRQLGYAPQPWNFGFNFGPRQGVLRGCVEHVRELHERHGRPVSLIGWSLGGVYAREVAKLLPAEVRCVVTLGTPFAGPPRANNAWRFYELVSRQKLDDEHELRAQLHVAPTVPTTSIYSRSDGIVSWPCSLNEAAPHTENIEVVASHTGLGVNPLALYAMLDRLAQDPRRWRRFDRPAALRWLMDHGPARPETAQASNAA
ncbi:alpha/beta hydrolase family protein [Rivibacter subsaxonicus]|uniref:Alpha/beta hydrolase family protein n=2 Tax=Rivibacter subsaxonicus TaxID=457575 RepID=A0A4Q7VDL0_9BURK|nr:alpha/beta hydrolase family protein [Rivibacter subsaxonicus]